MNGNKWSKCLIQEDKAEASSFTNAMTVINEAKPQSTMTISHVNYINRATFLLQQPLLHSEHDTAEQGSELRHHRHKDSTCHGHHQVCQHVQQAGHLDTETSSACHQEHAAAEHRNSKCHNSNVIHHIRLVACH